MPKKKPLSLRATFLKAMEKNGMRQSDLAELLGVSRQYINGYFAGRYNISHDYIERLLDYFGLVREPQAVEPTLLSATDIRAVGKAIVVTDSNGSKRKIDTSEDAGEYTRGEWEETLSDLDEESREAVLNAIAETNPRFFAE